MNNEKQLIRWEKHYSDGSVEFTDETSTKNFSDNLSCADGLIVTRSYIKMKPVNWHTLEQKLNKHNVMESVCDHSPIEKGTHYECSKCEIIL